jgi:hypothetical protein
MIQVSSYGYSKRTSPQQAECLISSNQGKKKDKSSKSKDDASFILKFSQLSRNQEWLVVGEEAENQCIGTATQLG